MRILDSATAAAVAAAADQAAQLAALIAPWAGGSVTARTMAGDTLLTTQIYGAWSVNAATPRELRLGAFAARTHVANGTPTRVVFRAGSTDIFDLTVTVAPDTSGDLDAASAVKATCREALDAMVITAVAALPQGFPTWRGAMAANTWAVIPSTNRLSDIDPNEGATDITPAGADYVARGMTLGLLAWTGGCWDDASGTFWIPLGGGHTDYGGNEPYKITIGVNSPSWVMVRPPTGSNPANGANWTPPIAPATTRDGNEANVVYLADGRLRSIHTYDNVAYVPGVGPAICKLPGVFYTATVSLNQRRVYTLDESTGEAVFRTDMSGITGHAPSPSSSCNDGAGVYDSRRHCLWIVGHGNSCLIQVDCTTWTATKRGGDLVDYMASAGGMVFVPGATAADDVLAIMSLGLFRIVRIGAGDYTVQAPSVSGSFSAGMAFTSFVGFGFDWAPELGKLVLWQNATNRTEISTLTPSNPANYAQPWVRGTLAVAGSNAVTPAADGSGTGMFGRFGYSSKLRGCYLMSSTNQDFFFFATE